MKIKKIIWIPLAIILSLIAYDLIYLRLDNIKDKKLYPENKVIVKINSSLITSELLNTKIWDLGFNLKSDYNIEYRGYSSFYKDSTFKRNPRVYKALLKFRAADKDSKYTAEQLDRWLKQDLEEFGESEYIKSQEWIKSYEVITKDELTWSEKLHEYFFN